VNKIIQTILLLAVYFGPASPLLGEQGAPECLSKYTKTNVCNIAADIQNKIAGLLPQKLNQNMTLMSVMAVGPSLGAVVVWHMTQADLQTSLDNGLMPISQLRSRLDDFTKKSVCSANFIKSFVRLGGKFSYIYKTSDGYQIHAISITNCPEL
jgi:hypothetical protein